MMLPLVILAVLIKVLPPWGEPGPLAVSGAGEPVE